MNSILKWNIIFISIVNLLMIVLAVVVTFVRKNRKEKLKEELNDIVKTASADALKELAEKKGEDASADTAQVNEIATAITAIEITEKDVSGAKTSVAKCVKTEADKLKIKAVDGRYVITAAQGKINAEIYKKAKEILKKITVKVIQENLNKVCEEMTKSATKAQVEDLVENESSFDEIAKTKFSENAKNAAIDIVNKAINMAEYAVDKAKIKIDARKAFENTKETIKRDVIYAAIKDVAGVTN